MTEALRRSRTSLRRGPARLATDAWDAEHGRVAPDDAVTHRWEAGRRGARAAAAHRLKDMGTKRVGIGVLLAGGVSAVVFANRHRLSRWLFYVE